MRQLNPSWFSVKSWNLSKVGHQTTGLSSLTTGISSLLGRIYLWIRRQRKLELILWLYHYIVLCDVTAVCVSVLSPPPPFVSRSLSLLFPFPSPASIQQLGWVEPDWEELRPGGVGSVWQLVAAWINRCCLRCVVPTTGPTSLFPFEEACFASFLINFISVFISDLSSSPF